MARAADYIGKKFGYVTILGIDSKDQYGRSRYKGQCACGNFCYPRKDSLNISGDRYSCGCGNGNRVVRSKAERLKRQTEKRRDSKIRHTYGIDSKQYNEMLERQNHVCAICDQKECRKNSWGEIRSLAIDHCHKTKKVRGLLCDDCNNLLGRAKDNQNILKKAIFYLKNHP